MRAMIVRRFQEAAIRSQKKNPLKIRLPFTVNLNEKCNSIHQVSEMSLTLQGDIFLQYFNSMNITFLMCF